MPARRRVLRSAATIGLTALAGCSALDATAPDGSASETDRGVGSADDPSRSATNETASPGGSSEVDPLVIATAGAASGPLRRLAAYWNGNPYGEDERDLAGAVGTGEYRFAGYFGRRYGFEASKAPNDPPFRVVVGTSDRDGAAATLADGRADLASLGSEAYSTVSEDVFVPSSWRRLDLFATGLPFAVSERVHDAGMTALSVAALRDVYAGRVENWRAVDGPDRPIHLVTRPSSNPSRPFERRFLRDVDAVASDAVVGRTDRRVGTLGERDDALSRVQVPSASVLREGGTSGYRFLDVVVDGESRAAGARGYPGTYPVPAFVDGSLDRRGRAFLAALATPAVHRFVLDPERVGLGVFPAPALSGFAE